MKKNTIIIVSIIIVLIIVGAIVVFAMNANNNNNGGSSNNASNGASTAGGNIAGTLEEIMTKLYAGIAEEQLPKLSNTQLTKENEEYYLGVSDLEFVEGLASEPMMSSVAHSVVLVKVKAGTDIAKAKADIKEKVDPRKWICVGVEPDDVIVESKGDLIVLIMDSEIGKDLQKNFQALK